MKLLIVLVAACSCFPYILTDDAAAAAAAAAAASAAAAAAAASAAATDANEVASAAAAAAAAAASGDNTAAAAAAAASGSGGSPAIPLCKCFDHVRTVCGSDNVSYRNLCLLNCQSIINQSKGLPPIHLQNHGACRQEACRCNYNWDPLCGSDGKTYANPCLLRCENRRRYALGLPPITVNYNGECVICKCTKIYDPVCASDGKTYGNPCLLRCENEIRRRKGQQPLKLLHKGVCTCNCNYCSSIFQPVCGSDNRTYWNVCWLVCNSQCNVSNGRPPINLVKNGYC